MSFLPILDHGRGGGDGMGWYVYIECMYIHVCVMCVYIM